MIINRVKSLLIQFFAEKYVWGRLVAKLICHISQILQLQCRQSVRNGHRNVPLIFSCVWTQ